MYIHLKVLTCGLILSEENTLFTAFPTFFLEFSVATFSFLLCFFRNYFRQEKKNTEVPTEVTSINFEHTNKIHGSKFVFHKPKVYDSANSVLAYRHEAFREKKKSGHHCYSCSPNCARCEFIKLDFSRFSKHYLLIVFFLDFFNF